MLHITRIIHNCKNILIRRIPWSFTPGYHACSLSPCPELTLRFPLLPQERECLARQSFSGKTPLSPVRLVALVL